MGLPMFVLVVLLLFSDGHHSAIVVNRHNTYSACDEAGRNASQLKDKRFRLLAYKCEQGV